MTPLPDEPPVAICVLTFGAHPALAKRVLESISQYVPRSLYRLVVGANAVGEETGHYLQTLREREKIDHLIRSEANLNKCPMMRQMFQYVRSEFVWWFDDDSYVTSTDALPCRLRIARSAPRHVVMWGERFMCEHSVTFCHEDPVAFVRSAPWYQGLPPPFWEPGGKGEFNFNGRGTGDGRWFFLTGGGWFIRSAALKALEWPDPRLSMFGEDVFLGEAIRQQGWQIEHIGNLGVEVNSAPRRWIPDERRLGKTSG